MGKEPKEPKEPKSRAYMDLDNPFDDRIFNATPEQLIAFRDRGVADLAEAVLVANHLWDNGSMTEAELAECLQKIMGPAKMAVRVLGALRLSKKMRRTWREGAPFDRNNNEGHPK